jgi:putative DNA primase/helicase
MQKFQNIPEELKRLPRWVCWRIIERDGKPTKVPVNPKTGGNAQSNNPETWGSFEAALERMQQDGLAGIGFMFNGDGVVGVDIDNCVNPDTGGMEQVAIDIIQSLDSYTEYSQSGRGIHIICRGKLPDGRRRHGPVEMYDSGRFFVMTGWVVGARKDIQERTRQLAQVHEKYIEKKPQKRPENNQKNIKTKQKTLFSQNEDEIIEKAMAAKNGSLFTQLMNGTWQGSYASQSEADLALCNILAFWTGGDMAMMDRIFRRSGLYRPKWDMRHGEGGTYGQMTMATAVHDCIEFYDPEKEKASGPNPEARAAFEKLVEQLDEDADYLKDVDTGNDMARAQVFAKKYEGQVLWCQDMKAWLIWNGKVWEVDRTLKIHELAKDAINEMVDYAARRVDQATGEDNIKKAREIFAATARARSERGVKAMLELAKSELPVTATELDKDPSLLNCQNGIIDLRTGELIPHAPEYHMSKIASASFDPRKKFQLFEKFLETISCGDQDLQGYFQQVCGMAAIGEVYHEGIAIFYGTGANGKSTFLNTIRLVLGDYAGQLNPEVFMLQRTGQQPAGIAEVKGKRFVTTVETEEGRRLSSSVLKQLSSTDPITARRLYENPITFQPTHTLILATNFLPKIGSTDAGTWRRIAVVPFAASIPEEKQVKNFAQELISYDADAILAWIVEGAKQFIKRGHNLLLPKCVIDATKQYRQEEDWLGNFLTECCEIGFELSVMGGELYEAYADWCERNNEYCRRSRDFAAALEAQGFQKQRTRFGSEWMGLDLISSIKEKEDNSKYGKWYDV